MNALQTLTYKAQEIGDQLAEFVLVFPTLTDSERKLLIDPLVAEVVLKQKEAAIGLTPPLIKL